jgi:uncharacterized protein (DUF952 family)
MNREIPEKLFRIVPHFEWQLAQQTGFIPRCGADEREGHIHLNEFSSIGFVTGVYFSAQEQPVALEISLDGLLDHLRWLPPTSEKPWRQPVLTVEQIPASRVVALHELLIDENGNFSPGPTIAIADPHS